MCLRRLDSLLAASLLIALSFLGCKSADTSPGPLPKELDSPSLLGAVSGSQNYIHAFAKRGIYPYHCTYHTTEHYREAGTVIVEDSGQDSAFVSIFQGAYHPQTTTVKPNAQVRWQNFDDGVHHTVTSD